MISWHMRGSRKFSRRGGGGGLGGGGQIPRRGLAENFNMAKAISPLDPPMATTFEIAVILFITRKCYIWQYMTNMYEVIDTQVIKFWS